MDFFSPQGLQALAEQAQRFADLANMDKLHEAQTTSVPRPLEPPGQASRLHPTPSSTHANTVMPVLPGVREGGVAVALPNSLVYTPYVPPVPAVESQSADRDAEDAFLADLLEAGISLEEAKQIRDGSSVGSQAHEPSSARHTFDSMQPLGPVPGRVHVPAPGAPRAEAGDPGSMFVGAFLAAQNVAGRVASATTSTLENVGAAILVGGSNQQPAARSESAALGAAGRGPSLVAPELAAAAPGVGQGSLWRVGHTSTGSSAGPLSPISSLMSYLAVSPALQGEGAAVLRGGGQASAAAAHRNPGAGFVTIPGLGGLLGGTIRAPSAGSGVPGPEGNPALLARGRENYACLETVQLGCSIMCEPVIGFWTVAVTFTAIALRVVGVAASAGLVCCGGARLAAVLRRILSNFTDRQLAAAVLALALLWLAWTSGFLQLAWWVVLKLLRPLIRMVDGSHVSTLGGDGSPALLAATTGSRSAPLLLSNAASGAADSAVASIAS